MWLTIVEPLDGSSQRKQKLRCPDGQVISIPTDKLIRGRVSVWPVPYAHQLALALDSLTDQAVMLGVPQGPARASWWMVTKKQEEAHAALGAGVLTRSLDHFGWPGGPGWMLVDLDKLPPAAGTISGALAMLAWLWPEIAEASLVVRPSASAGIAGGGPGGMHAFVLVAEPARSRAMLEELDRRAGSAGLGEIIDTSVGSPERLIYAAPPLLLGGLTRNAEPAWWKEGCAIGMAGMLAKPDTRAEAAAAAVAPHGAPDPASWDAGLREAVDGYLLSVLHGQVSDIRAARKGARSRSIFAAGSRLGNYAWTASRVFAGAGDILLEATVASGYTEDYSLDIARNHLARGWENGCAKPEVGIPAIARWERKDEILATGAALIRLLQRKN